MRILMVNWAPIQGGALLGGGANGYLNDLAAELRARGHQVGSISSGLTHIPDIDGKQGPCQVRRGRDYQGIQTFEIVNSPVLAWSMHQFRHPRMEISAPDLESEFSRFIRVWKPEVVHFHNIEGLTSMCPEIARAPSGAWPGARVVYSLHNYHTICPQVFLMHGGRTPCTHFDNGHRCVSCYDAPHTHIVLNDRLREAARAAGRIEATVQSPPDGLMQRLLRKPRLVADIPLPGNPVESEADLVERGDEAPADHHTDGIAMDRGAGMVGVGGVGPATQVTIEGGPLTNEIAAGARSDLEPNDYALRRRAMVRMLSGCDRVLAVSAFVGRMFESMGVDRNRLRTLPIGSRMPEIAQGVGVIDEPRPIAATGDGENRTLTRPLRLAFLGYHNFYKGLHVVCAALEQLPEQTRRQIDLAVHAKDVGPITPRLRQLSRTLSRVVVEDGYRPEDVPLLLRSVDLGLVPSVWWDNGPQTVLEFLSCRVPVLASCVGGIPDVIEHGRNGLLVPGNDPGALAREIERIVLDPSVLATLRRGITAPKSMATHATEIEAIYGECLRDAAL